MNRWQISSARGHWGRVVTAALLLSAVMVTSLSADLLAPTPKDRQITLAVTSLLRKGHLSRHPLDDEISQRCLKSYLKTLDPMKVYFYASDVERFQQSVSDLDNAARRGDIQFAYDVFNTFLQRIDERVAVIDELLAAEHDFTVDEEMITDADALNYPRDAAEARERWRKRIKYDLLVQKADDLSREEAVEKLTRRYHSFAKRMRQTDQDELLEMFLSSLTTGFDPHTTYMSPSTLDNFEISMRLQLEGIGAALQFIDGYTVVNKIIPGGAADKHGQLKPEDRVIGVGQGTGGEIVDVVDMKLSDVVQLIRGKQGTVVRLQVIPLGETVPVVYDITRARIELKDSEARSQIFAEGRKPDGEPYRIGVIDLPSFYMDMNAARLRLPNFKSTTRDVRRLLEEFQEQGVDAVVMDLRKNGGGSLTEAINLTGLFIDQGPVVQVRDADGEVQSYDDLERGVAWDGPLVVLISKFSASASEIFAGAIQDYQRGLIVGDYATHGKGTVQTLRELGRELFFGPNPPKLGALKITMQKFYRPSGDSTQSRGVLSDIELPSLTTHLDIAESDLDYCMEFDQVEPAQYDRLGYVDPPLVNQLRMLSRQRISESDDFQKVLEKIDRYKERKERKSVLLHEEKFLADRASLNTEKEEEKTLENFADPSGEVIKRDYYFNETLAITLDYLKMMTVAQAN